MVDLLAPLKDPSILRHLTCLWSGHVFEPWDVRWSDGQSPSLAVYRCRRCHHQRNTA